ncbi:M23 family metallopeptidase [Novosphingobium pituita]|nr:M23 family metallopeptidase [Novosphingobium sp. IK01]MDK4806017.1 M23 family metallopeptidase [Novosphingobium aromaticivorans]HIQ18610.1 M23 family metallopeptidase [Novosphingobium capsulatum]
MLLKKSIAVGLAALGMGVAGLGLSAPAFANSAAAADITTPLRATDGAKAGGVAPGGDEEFSKLFASWEALDGGSAGTSSQAPLVRSATVSIPTLVPVLSSRAMSSGFGLRTHPIYGGLRAHKGVDLPAPTGTPIRATADGVVGKAERFGGYGLFVELEHGGNLETRYGHMSRIAVAEGQHVHKGDVIGYVGSTGHSTGPHLHYEVRVAGQAVNPLAYMQRDDSLRRLASAADVNKIRGFNTPDAESDSEE